MSPEVYAAFNRICREEAIDGPVLEVGAWPGPDSLLNLPALATIHGKTGINQDAFPDGGGIDMIVGNANRMDMFGDHSFGCVLCNATLEHDARFWETVAEIRRVTKPGGVIVIGVPGYRGMGPLRLAPPRSLVGRLIGLLATVTKHDALVAGTSTLGVHNFPGDYYRFSEQAVRDVFLEGLVEKQVRWVMTPPRVIGWARKPS